MLTPFPSATAVALALGARLTLRGLTLRRNPWTFGVRVSHPDYRYSCQHSHFRCLQPASRQTFTGLRNAPLPLQKTGIRNQGSELRREGPHLHLVGRADRHHDKAMELGARLTLLAKPFG